MVRRALGGEQVGDDGIRRPSVVEQEPRGPPVGSCQLHGAQAVDHDRPDKRMDEGHPYPRLDDPRRRKRVDEHSVPVVDEPGQPRRLPSVDVIAEYGRSLRQPAGSCARRASIAWRIPCGAAAVIQPMLLDGRPCSYQHRHP